MAYPSFQTTSFNCYLRWGSFKRPGSEKGLTCYIQCTHTPEEQDSQKYWLHKSQQDNAQLKINKWHGMRSASLVSLDFTCVYLPPSEPLLHKQQNCCCRQTNVALGFWPEATGFRRKGWPRAEMVAATFTHLGTENTPCFPTSSYHGKIILEALKWIKSNFLPLPIDWYWYPRCGKFPTIFFWGV